MILGSFKDFAPNFLKIRTKTQGIRPFQLRKYQIDFSDLIENTVGPKRFIVLKPRQSGFSTECAGIFTQKILTNFHYQGIALADKKDRTLAIRNIYSTFLQEYPEKLKPMIAKNNTEEILLDNPDFQLRAIKPGLGSGVTFETANDPNAGRAASRLFAHLSEFAFYRYALEIDEGIQNSIPLDDNSLIIKESTANGRSGIGKPFYDLWQAAKMKESIYIPFFVPWYEIDDYKLPRPPGTRLNKVETDLIKRGVSEENLIWRRLKLREYSEDDLSYMGAEERFNQDFPIDDETAFRFSGSPVFDIEEIQNNLKRLETNLISDKKEHLNIKDEMMRSVWPDLVVYSAPRGERTYFIGADVAEGLAQGDSSSVFIMDDTGLQVAKWHGKIQPDLFGHLLVSLGEYYNNALITVEKNNMGHTTVTSIRQLGYHKLYRETVEDKITKEKSLRFGWVTTSKSKMTMLNEGVKAINSRDVTILDKHLLTELGQLSRGDNGDVQLNSKDRTVAFCLSLMGFRDYKKPARLDSKSPELYDLNLLNKKKNKNRVDSYD